MQEVGDGTSSGIAGIDNGLGGTELVLQSAEGALKSPGEASLLEVLGTLDQAADASGQVLHNAVPVPEALVARLAGREVASEAAGTLVAAHP